MEPEETTPKEKPGMRPWQAALFTAIGLVVIYVVFVLPTDRGQVRQARDDRMRAEHRAEQVQLMLQQRDEELKRALEPHAAMRQEGGYAKLILNPDGSAGMRYMRFACGGEHPFRAGHANDHEFVQDENLDSGEFLLGPFVTEEDERSGALLAILSIQDVYKVAFLCQLRNQEEDERYGQPHRDGVAVCEMYADGPRIRHFIHFSDNELRPMHLRRPNGKFATACDLPETAKAELAEFYLVLGPRRGPRVIRIVDGEYIPFTFELPEPETGEEKK